MFIEPMGVVETNNDIKLLKGREQEEIERILTALSGECGDNADMLIASYHNMIELDLLFAKANLAYDMDCSLPVVTADGVIDLKKARHPLIHKKKVVPSDIHYYLLSRGIDVYGQGYVKPPQAVDSSAEKQAGGEIHESDGIGTRAEGESIG